MAIHYPNSAEQEALLKDAGDLSGKIILEKIFFEGNNRQEYNGQRPKEWWMNNHGLDVMGELKIAVVEAPILGDGRDNRQIFINPTAWRRALLIVDKEGNGIDFWCYDQGINFFQILSNLEQLPNYYYRRFNLKSNVLNVLLEQSVVFRRIGSFGSFAWEDHNEPYYQLAHIIGDFYPHPKQQHYFTQYDPDALKYYGQSGFGRVMKILRGQLMMGFPVIAVNTEEGRLTSVRIGDFNDGRTNLIYTYEHSRSK